MSGPREISRPWLASYPPGVPATIDPDAHRSLRQLLEHSMERNATRPAYISLGRTLSYADLERLSASRVDSRTGRPASQGSPATWGRARTSCTGRRAAAMSSRTGLRP
jgi:hypothetical protein